MRRADTWVRRAAAALRIPCMWCGNTGTVNGAPCTICRPGGARAVA